MLNILSLVSSCFSMASTFTGWFQFKLFQHPTINGFPLRFVTHPTDCLGKSTSFFGQKRHTCRRSSGTVSVAPQGIQFLFHPVPVPWTMVSPNVKHRWKKSQPTNQLPLPGNTGATSSTSPDMKSLEGEPPAGSESSPDHVKYPSQMGLRIKRFSIKP